MVMIREHRPSFDLPREGVRHSEKAALQNVETLRSAKMVCFKISASCKRVGAIFGELVTGRMRPGNGGIRHGKRLAGALWKTSVFCHQVSEKRRSTAAHNVAVIPRSLKNAGVGPAKEPRKLSGL